MIVVDASVLADFLLGRPQTLQAVDNAIAEHEHEPLHAPELIELETLTALRGLARGGAVSDRRASEAVQDLALLRLVRYPHASLRERIWELRANLTGYDAAYLALSEALDGATLLTADTGLAAAARASLGSERVTHVP